MFLFKKLLIFRKNNYHYKNRPEGFFHSYQKQRYLQSKNKIEQIISMYNLIIINILYYLTYFIVHIHNSTGAFREHFISNYSGFHSDCIYYSMLILNANIYRMS